MQTSFRPHCGTLTDSVAASFNVTCIKDIVDKMNEVWADHPQAHISENDVIIKYYGFDERIEEDCYILSLKNNKGVLGFTKKLIPYTTTPRYKI